MFDNAPWPGNHVAMTAWWGMFLALAWSLAGPAAALAADAGAGAGYIRLSYADVGLSAALFVIATGASLLLRLGLWRSLVWVALRMVAQLLLVGMVLRFIFAATNIWVTLAAAAVMAGMAMREVMNRQERPLAGAWRWLPGPASMVLIGSLAVIYTQLVVLRPEPWYAPRQLLPIFGMVLGNAMNGVSLGLNAITRAVVRERAAIEARLLLGFSRWRALRPFVAEALRTALTPMMNAMAAAGIISLPGMMTGQILAGAPPVEAVKYQLMIMFLIAGVVGVAALAAMGLALWRLTDERHRLRSDRLAVV